MLEVLHQYFLNWQKDGFFVKLWQAGLAEFDEMEGIAWEWQSIDSSIVKAPLGQEAVGNNPTDSGKKGSKCAQDVRTCEQTWMATVSKRHILVEGHGVPLSIVVTAATDGDREPVQRHNRSE